jgi:hypothetical protein
MTKAVPVPVLSGSSELMLYPRGVGARSTQEEDEDDTDGGALGLCR